MNKKNFQIFISILITSIFFTMAFYFSYSNIKSNYQAIRAEFFFDGKISGQYTVEEIKKLEDIEDIMFVGGILNKKDSARFNNSMLVINYQNSGINEMAGSAYIIDGEFPKNEDEIILSKDIMDENNLSIGDKIELSFGNRILENRIIDAMGTFTDREEFQENSKKTYSITGVYINTFNKYMNLSLGITYPSKDEKLQTYIQFNNFEKAYGNKEKIAKEIEGILGQKANLEISEDMIRFFRVEDQGLDAIMPKLVMGISLIIAISIFVFFIKNIFWVWGIRKIVELSIYKSIGSTNFQIYLVLFKEALWISLLPIFLGHGIGYFLINTIYKKVQQVQKIDKIRLIGFSPTLSLAIILVSILIIAFAIIQTAKNISKIEIIDGIKGNINLRNKKKKKHKNLWKELRLNNLAAIKSQRYISAIGLIIISIFLIIIGISLYYKNYARVDTDYNVNVYYTSKDQRKPKVLEDIMEEIPNEKSYIFKTKYFTLENDWILSEKVEEKLVETLEEYQEERGLEKLEGDIIALEEKELTKLGGSKGEFLLLNKVQEDPKQALAKAEYIEFFKNPKELTIYLSGVEPMQKIKIKKSITTTGEIERKLLPFEIHVFTDIDTLNNMIENHPESKNVRANYELKMKVDEKDLNDSKEYIESKLKNSVSFDERFKILTGDEIAEKEYTDIKSFSYVVLGLGAIILILNITNAYSAINISLMSRKGEIGTLYSLGMDKESLKRQYSSEFIKEQIKSFVIVFIATFVIMFVISILSKNFTIILLIKYYPYIYFVAFSLVIYVMNISIYLFSLKKMLNMPIIELIRTK